MLGIVNKLVKTYLEYHYRKLHQSISNPIAYQSDLLTELLFRAQDTEYGRAHHYRQIAHYQDFQNSVPVVTYDDIQTYIKRMISGEENILWPGRIAWYAKSSGTTSDKSKFIPVSQDKLKNCHIKGGWDAIAALYQILPDARIFAEKSMVMGGSLAKFDNYPDTWYGDVSAIMLQHIPMIGKPFYTPDRETAMMDKWDEKIERMAQVVKDENITMFGGVPTWTIVLFDRILELTGKQYMSDVWPEARIYMHGGVNFDPYRAQFESYFQRDDFIFQQIYNATEGFFAAQIERRADDMALLVDNGIFYEFIPYDGTLAVGDPIPLEDVVIDQRYAMVISTCAGLWRYQPGDLVVFTSTDPYKIKVVGRTSQYINAFGEEVMVSNTDEALTRASAEHGATVSDYTVAPVYLTKHGKGRHQWLVEFETPPASLASFTTSLDWHLQQVNSDYEAKRAYDLALECLSVEVLPPGTFHDWLRSKGRIGGQHKVPRLSNDRSIMDSLLAFVAKS